MASNENTAWMKDEFPRLNTQWKVNEETQKPFCPAVIILAISFGFESLISSCTWYEVAHYAHHPMVGCDNICYLLLQSDKTLPKVKTTCGPGFRGCLDRLESEGLCCAHLCPCPYQMTEKATLCSGRIVHKGLKFGGKQRESQFRGSRASAVALCIIRAVQIRQWGNDCVGGRH